jgi:hypothetical protein
MHRTQWRIKKGINVGCLLHDNAWPHIATGTRAFLEEFKCEKFQDSLYTSYRTGWNAWRRPFSKANESWSHIITSTLIYMAIECRRSWIQVDCVWNVIAHAQKSDLVFRRNGQVQLNRRGRQFSRLPAAEVCASALLMLDKPCYEVVRRVLATHSIRQFPLHFPSRASPCAISFQVDSTNMVE